MIRSVLAGIAGGVVIALAAIGGMITNWALDDSLPRRVDFIKVENDPVKPGDKLGLRFFGESFRDCSTYVKETITDSKGLLQFIKPREGKLNTVIGPLGNGKGAILWTPTPADAAPGPALYESDVYYSCNPWQHLFPLHVHMVAPFHFN